MSKTFASPSLHSERLGMTFKERTEETGRVPEQLSPATPCLQKGTVPVCPGSLPPPAQALTAQPFPRCRPRGAPRGRGGESLTLWESILKSTQNHHVYPLLLFRNLAARRGMGRMSGEQLLLWVLLNRVQTPRPFPELGSQDAGMKGDALYAPQTCSSTCWIVPLLPPSASPRLFPLDTPHP